MLVRFKYVFSNAIVMDCAVKYADVQRRAIQWMHVRSGGATLNTDIELSDGRRLFDVLADEARHHA